MITKEQATKIATENLHKMERYKSGHYKSIEYVCMYEGSFLFCINRKSNGGHFGPTPYCTVDAEGKFTRITDLEKRWDITDYLCKQSS